MSLTLTRHRPYDIFDGKATTPYAVLILNQPINISALNAILAGASLLVCADGAGNRLHAYHVSSAAPYDHRLPDAIVGDLDSLSSEAGEYYRSKGVNIIRDPDQYSTDFGKCLKYLRHTWNGFRGPADKLDILALGGLGGRVDHGFSQIQDMFKAQNDMDRLNGRIFLLSEQSLSFILDQGVNEIHVGSLEESSSGGGIFKENVGIIPITGPAKISIKGFEWDVDDWETKFGGNISTSNHLRSEAVMVNVKEGGQCLFTLELADNLCLGS